MHRAYFNGASFGEANFEGAKFSAGAEFKRATFNDTADFKGVAISEEANFEGSTFSEGAYFEAAAFSGLADFSAATFHDAADFEGATFGGRAYFNRTVYESSVSFVNAKLESRTLFRAATFRCEPPMFFGAKLHEGTVWREARWPDPPDNTTSAGRFVDAYERLKLEMDRLKKHEDELDFFARELQCRRVLLGDWAAISKLSIFGYSLPIGPLRVPEVSVKQRDYHLFSRRFVLIPSFSTPAMTIPLYRPAGGLPIVLYGFLCNYGRSYVRPLLLLIATIVIGALPFWPVFGIGRALGLSFANTFAVLGIRKDLIESAILTSLPSPLKACATIQTGLGIVLLFLFSLGLRNRFRMK